MVDRRQSFGVHINFTCFICISCLATDILETIFLLSLLLLMKKWLFRYLEDKLEQLLIYIKIWIPRVDPFKRDLPPFFNKLKYWSSPSFWFYPPYKVWSQRPPPLFKPCSDSLKSRKGFPIVKLSLTLLSLNRGSNVASTLHFQSG